MDKISFGIALWIIAAALLFSIFRGKEAEIVTFEECVQAENPVLESYPRQCRDEDGTIFIEMIGRTVFLP